VLISRETLYLLRVTDNGVPNLSDAKTFTVGVLPRPVLEAVSNLDNTVTLTWSAISGVTYRIQFRTYVNDLGWVDLAPDITATGPTASMADSSATNDTRFYRVQVVP
jgi:hypothetical protein